MLANVSASSGSDQISLGSIDSIILKVDIPCSGHAPLISEELKTINGIQEVKYSTPNIFAVKYDSGRTSKTEILKLAVFKEYPATVLSENQTKATANNSTQSQSCSSSKKTSCCGS